MPEVNFDQIRSEEVQEIIGQTPPSLIRWGLTVLFMIMVMLFCISWFVKYPDILKAPVVITTDPAPTTLVSRTSGRITLLKKDNELCHAGELIEYIQSNANPTAVVLLEDQLIRNQPLRISKSVGDLQTYVSAYTRAEADLHIFEATAAHQKQIGQQRNGVRFSKKRFC